MYIIFRMNVLVDRNGLKTLKKKIVLKSGICFNHKARLAPRAVGRVPSHHTSNDSYTDKNASNNITYSL